jgi:hypothetical protein
VKTHRHGFRPTKEQTMAKTRGRKSKAIRDYLATKPNAKAKEVVDALASKGVKVTANLVYYLMGQVKSSKNQQMKRQARQAKVAAVVTSDGDLVKLIQEVRSLAKKAGGYGKLKELADALAG